MMWRRLTRVVLGLGLLAAGAGAVYAWLALPRTQGTVEVAGLQAPVRIERDAQGIPSIKAGSLEDLMFGLGYAHAQDRLWQLETHRRIGAGRLAEAFGAKAVDTDRFLRTLGVRRAAAAQWAQTQGESRRVLAAYAAGINAHLRGAMRARPPEFLALGIAPEDWDPVDSLAWSIMMAWDLGGNWGNELLRMRLALRMPQERVEQLLPPYPGETPPRGTDYAALYRGLKLDATLADAHLDRLLAAAPPSGIEGVGSNNWVLAGSRTTTGRPLLANDPHLKLSAPALWYFARLEAPGFKVAGATMPGLPLVVLGQNRHIAWGFTNTNPDVQDLYLEELRPGDPMQYRTPEGWARFEQVEEVLKVRGAPEQRLTLRATRHGPVISDAGGMDDVLASSAGGPRYVLALRWTALDADVDPVGTGLALQRADSVRAFVRAARSWVAPMQNMVVADDAGRIGYVAGGRVPVRGPGHDLHGRVPALGWEARYDWTGWVPADETPREFDPPRGWIATANQKIHGPDYPHYLTGDWAPPYRQQRIEQWLESRSRHSIESLRELQADLKSLATPRLLPWLLKARSDHPLASAALGQLSGFDGTMAPDRAAPLIFWAWTRQLSLALFADEVGEAVYERALGGRNFREALEGALERDDAWWCDDKRTPAGETCAEQAGAALTRTLDELQARHGADPARWRWDQAHQARSEHRPFSQVRALAGLFELRAPVGGDTYTVNVSRVNLRPDPGTGELYLNEHGPSLRAIYDLGDPAQSRFMHSSGQSGLPWSAHYRSFVGPWARVDYLPVWARGEAAAVLTLQPRP